MKLTLTESEVAEAISIVQKAVSAWKGAQPQLAQLDLDTKALEVSITSGLVQKPDGSAYTADELHALALKAEAPADEVIDRDSQA